MNESEFEAELRALKPAAPSPALFQRINAELPATQAIAVAATRTLAPTPAAGVVARAKPTPVWVTLLRGMLWASAGAAVAVVVLTSQPPTTVPKAPANAALYAEQASSDVPEEQTVSELIAAADEGLYVDETGSDPQRQMRLTYLERHVWTNPETGAVIEFEVPREDIVMMPVAMQ